MLVFIIPSESEAGFLSRLFGIGSYEDCISGKLDRSKTSVQIQKIQGICKEKYPKAVTIEGSTNVISLPFVEVPTVPLVVMPSIPLVQTPTKQ